MTKGKKPLDTAVIQQQVLVTGTVPASLIQAAQPTMLLRTPPPVFKPPERHLAAFATLHPGFFHLVFSHEPFPWY